MRTVLLVLLLLPGLASAVSVEDHDLAALQQANTLLKAEYEQARTGKPYLLIDLPEQQVRLKASGMMLEFWKIDGYRLWGHPSALPATNLERKFSFDDPERDVQIANADAIVDATPSQKLRALELADMPTAYRLHLENGTEITVRPSPDRWLDRLQSRLAVSAWYLSRPLISNWKFLHGSPYNELALSMSARDARMLYWAFSEGTPCLIRLPGAVATALTLIGTNR